MVDFTTLLLFILVGFPIFGILLVNPIDSRHTRTNRKES